jgi:phosphatidylglycerophosphate synthase
VAQVALLATLAETVGLSGPGWVVGVSCGLVTYAAVTRGLARSDLPVLGKADRVTLVRATLAGGVAALTADSIGGSPSLTALMALTVVALVLDAVDGWVARRTATTSTFGARFDTEVDAFLILVLSVYVAPSTGTWVLAIGLARYVFVAAGWWLPWMRGAVPPRYWCKVVAAIQAIVLAFAAARVLPRSLTDILLLAALVLLAESFGREVWWLWRDRDDALADGAGRPAGDEGAQQVPGIRSGVRTVAAWGVTALAGGLVWFALVGPEEISGLTLSAFLRIPVEGLVLVTVAVAVPVRVRQVLAALVGLGLGLLTILKILDMGFFEELDRPFNPVTDRGYFGPAVGVLSDSIGRTDAISFVVAALVLFLGILVFMPLSVMRLSRLTARHRTGSIRAVSVIGLVWVLCAVTGAQLVDGAPIASTSAAGLAYDQVVAVRDGLEDRQIFARLAADDAFRGTPARDLLTGLRGKDVIVAFVESYGQVAVQGSSFSPRVDATLEAGTRRLRAAGFSSRSAFLTSPTFGGISWLAHSTLQSGLWVDTQQRYDQLTAGDRFTLSDAFKRAGWRTVGDVPSNGPSWPDGTAFYHYDKTYNDGNVGYVGPRFSYATMPDQYVLSAFQRLELAKAQRRPVMAEIDLVSSHTPWAPLPHLVPWSKVGDGAVFDNMPSQGQSPAAVWRDAGQVQAAYGQSIQYTLNALVSFVQTYADKNLVLVVLGDHQPATIVSGQDASHEVPISIIAHDPAVMHRISGWGWQEGLRPGPNAPVWPMSAFRDRFLTAYGPQTQQTP